MFKNISDRREQEEKMKQENRLPPGQSLTKKFPVLHYGPVPKFNPATWDLHLWGEVEQEVRLTWDEFIQLPRTSLEMDIHCVTKWSKFDTKWEGVHLKTLLDEGIFKLKPEANYVIQHAEYGYTANLPLEVMFGENFLLATHFDGEPLTPEHGYPLRGVVGQIVGSEELKVPYFWKGAKWLRGLEFRVDDQLGFWEQAGYHNEADVWKEQRYGRG
jgi:DMSO/TMAO reductase YedYZ molybdopterin-dependent catalytic subunit